MSFSNRFALSLSLALGLASGCSGADGGTTPDDDEHAGGEHGEHHGEGHGDRHRQGPPTLVAFHEVLAPVWHSDPGEGRGAAGCAAVTEMRDAASAITAAAAPEHLVGTPEEWAAAAGALASAVQELGTICEQTPDEAEAQLTRVHDAFHALGEQLPGDGH